MVESAVDLAEKWIIASLNEDVFYSLAEYNAEVRRKVDWLNDRPFQQKDGSRRSVYEEEEYESLGRLPDHRFELVQWAKYKVAPNSHVKVDYMFYSTHFSYLGQRLDVKKSAARIDIFSKGVMVASHERKLGKKGQYSTEPEHMPSFWGIVDNPWTPERFIRWAEGIGPATKEATGRVLASRVIVEQAFVPCQNILGLAKTYGKKQLEEACKNICGAILAAPTYTAVKEECIALRRKKEEQSPIHVEEQGSDKLKDKGRTRGAEHYRLNLRKDGE